MFAMQGRQQMFSELKPHGSVGLVFSPSIAMQCRQQMFSEATRVSGSGILTINCHARQAADVLWTEATRVSRSSVLTINCHAMQAANVLWSHKGQWVWHSHHQLPCNAGSKCSLKPQGSVGLAFSPSVAMQCRQQMFSEATRVSRSGVLTSSLLHWFLVHYCQRTLTPWKHTVEPSITNSFKFWLWQSD